MPSLRTPEGKKRYRDYQKDMLADKACPICEREATKAFTYWKIIENSFPYDLIADTHHMIAPHRHVVEKDLTGEEMVELVQIKNSMIEEKYDYILESTRKHKSLPDHFHLHLLIGKAS